MGTLLHILKAAVLAVMMFFSLVYLGFNTGGAIVFSMVPLMLGVLSVFTGFAYGLTGFVFILACALALMPDWRTKTEGIAGWVVQEVQKNHESQKTNRTGNQDNNKEKP
jgi:lysylphosphatidylglycerol synthetase-like protein (DUF2156 family)